MPDIHSERQGSRLEDDITATTVHIIGQRGSGEDMSHEVQPPAGEGRPEAAAVPTRPDDAQLAAAGLVNLLEAASRKAVAEGLDVSDPAAYGHIVTAWRAVAAMDEAA